MSWTPHRPRSRYRSRKPHARRTWRKLRRRPQYKALTAAKWDIIIIMLGTNDAKDKGDHGPDDWVTRPSLSFSTVSLA